MNKALINYVKDTENPETNLTLALEYKKVGQTASAISYFLRAADRTDNLNFAYECLLHMASCFYEQKNRDYTVKGLYQHAISLLPKRPEAYYLYARYLEWIRQYAESYTICCIGLNTADFNLNPLKTIKEYPGKCGIIFEKAVSSYWWGKSKESRELFQLLLDDYYFALDDTHKKLLRNNFNNLGMSFPYVLDDEKQKLKEFPSVYYLSLEESLDRRIHLENQFKEYNITKINSVISKRFKECDDVIHGKFVNTLIDGSKGCCTSHLKCIKKWLNETDEPYGFFCEDDLSLETIKHWNFTWEDFINHLPQDWECVQLMWVRDQMVDIKLRERYFDDWSATAYILKRERAERLIDTYYPTDEFCFDIPNTDLQPIVENLVFSLGKVYTFPLFVEEIKKFDTCLIDSDEFDGLKDDWEIIDGQGPAHVRSYHEVMNWWRKTGSKLKVNQILALDTSGRP